jgi:hypothetical protein
LWIAARFGNSLDCNCASAFTNKVGPYGPAISARPDAKVGSAFQHRKIRPWWKITAVRRAPLAEWTARIICASFQLPRRIAAIPVTGEMSFNQVQLHHVHCLIKKRWMRCCRFFTRRPAARCVTLWRRHADEDLVMDHIGEIYEKHAVRFHQPGDMVSLDNMLVRRTRSRLKRSAQDCGGAAHHGGWQRRWTGLDTRRSFFP